MNPTQSLRIQGLLFLLALVCTISLRAQLAGSYTVPGSFPSLATAISTLNSVGVSGPVTINIQAGYTETVPVGGFTLNLISGASATSEVIFRKSGAGVNPVISAYSGGTATPTSAMQDGIWKFVGVDYVTIDGIDLSDPNTTNPATMEFGYGFFKAGINDGCLYNTIKNCTISLSSVNNAPGTGVSPEGSKGIWFVDALITANTTALNSYALSGSNSYNKFYSNTIQSCNIGIMLYASLVSNAINDNGNDIGGSSASTGNTIINYGGGGTVACTGVYTLGQKDLNVSFNYFNNNTGAGTDHPGSVKGINARSSANSNTTINSNTLSLHGSATSVSVMCIQNFEVNASTPVNTVNVCNNLITGCTYTAASGQFAGILQSGSEAILNVSFNRANNNLLAGGSSQVFAVGGYSLTNVLSNTVTNTTYYGSGSNIFGLSVGSSGSALVNNNLIDGVSFLNVSGANYTGIYDGTTGNFTANGNIIRNISAPAGTLRAIRQDGSAGIKAIQNNQIYNFTTTVTGGTVTSAMYGIWVTDGTVTVSGNSIYSLSTPGSTNNFSAPMFGIYLDGSGSSSANISKNSIRGLFSGARGGETAGIFINGSRSNTITNNVIGDLQAINTINAGTGICGMTLMSFGALNKIYNNTIYLNAVTSSTSFGSSAVYFDGSATLDLRNNILVNTSVFSGSSANTAIIRRGSSSYPISFISSHNLYYAGVPTASNVLFCTQNVTLQTLPALKAYMVLQDMFSVTENPPFATTNVSSPNYLNINPSVGTQVESGGESLALVPDDIAGTTRHATTPDIGAWEGNYTLSDIQGPGITGYGFIGSACNLSARTFTAALSDISSVAGGTLSPRLYYRVNTGTFTSVPGVMASGSPTNGIWSFNLSYTASAMDSIQYFLVAQDVFSTPNLMAYPPAGFSGVNVNTITTVPSSLLSYTLQYTLNGTYTVGAGGTFTSLSRAAYAYDNACITGPITFVLTNTLYSNATGETFPILFTDNPGVSATNSLLIKPDVSVLAGISAFGASYTPIFQFSGARYITMDGINSPGAGISVYNGNYNSRAIQLNVSNNLLFKRVRAYSSANFGSFYSSGSSNTIAVMDCELDGIYVDGTATVITQFADNWLISGNKIGGSSLGINLTSVQNATITRNNIDGINGNPAANGISIPDYVNNLSISQNTVQNVNSYNNTPFGGGAVGIGLSDGVKNFTINSNYIRGISSTKTTGDGVRGLLLRVSSTSTTTGLVCNNMISDIYCYSGNSRDYWPVGIDVDGSDYITFDNNSVYLSGQHASVTGTIVGSAALLVQNNALNLKLRNNILANTYAHSNTNSVAYGLYRQSGTFSTIDYNDYYAGAPTGTNTFVFYNTALNTLPAIQGIGGNVNSQTVLPVFTATNDLHIQAILANVAFDNLGQPIGITDDIDQQSRSTVSPDIGADEFTTICSAASGGTIAAQNACAGQTFMLNAQGAGTGITVTNQWKYSLSAGGPYTNVPGGAFTGTTAPILSTSFTAGTYYFVLENTCGQATLTNTSPEASVTIYPLPTVTAAVSPSVLCSGQIFSLSALSSTTGSYFWNGPLSYTTAVQNPTVLAYTHSISGAYSVKVTDARGCTSLPSVISVTVKGTPTPVTVTPPSTLMCSTNVTTLSVSGGLIPGVFNFTPQISQNTATAYPAPYSAYYGGQKMQMLIRGSELIAAGLVAGPITGIEFPVISKGLNWGSGIQELQNFQVRIDDTFLSSLGSTFQNLSGGSSVPVNYTPAIGYNNTHLFANTYNWNGINNIIVEVVFSNNSSGGTGNAVIQYNSPTLFQSTLVYAADNQPVNVIAGATSSNIAVGLNRPDFKLIGTTKAAYSWTPSAGLSSATGSSVTASPSVSTVYTLTAFNGTCTATDQSTINVTVLPTLAIVPSSTILCSGNSVTLTATGAQSYTWNNGTVSTSLVVSPATNTVYTISNKTAPCPQVTGTLSLPVYTLPVVGISASSNTICSGKTYTLIAYGANSYTWNTGPAGPQTTISATSPVTYSVDGTSSDGCTSSATLSISPDPTPVLMIASSAASVCPGKLATFTATGADIYSWSNGSNGSVTSVAVTTPTTYTVAGTNTFGCLATQTVAVKIYPAPILAITPSSATICPQGTASFTVSGAHTYTWNGSVQSSTASFSPSSSSVILVAGTETVNSCSSNTSVLITVQQPPLINISASGPSVCPGAAVSFTASGANTYTWLSPGGNNAVVTVTPSGPSGYTVSGSGSFGCVSSKTVSVGIYKLPVILVSPAQQTICADEIASFAASGAGTYTWIPGNFIGSTFTVSSSVPATYTVMGTDLHSCRDDESAQLFVDPCTGISENKGIAELIRIFPNPSNGEIQAHFELEGHKTISVLNALGEVMETHETENKQESFDFSHYAKGLYFLTVRIGAYSASFRVILQ